jgi:hypothetical protein
VGGILDPAVQDILQYYRISWIWYTILEIYIPYFLYGFGRVKAKCMENHTNVWYLQLPLKFARAQSGMDEIGGWLTILRSERDSARKGRFLDLICMHFEKKVDK